MNKVRTVRLGMMFFLAFVSGVKSAYATSYVWDIDPGTVGVGNGTLTGGTGNWDAGTGNWSADGGANNVAWPSSGTDNDAVFDGVAGTVSLAAPGVAANDLAFNVGTYTIQNATLTLNGTTPTVTVSSGVNAIIRAPVAGSVGLIKAGSGMLTLRGTNTYSGTTIISAGAVTLDTPFPGGFNNGAIPNSPITVNGGGTLIVSNEWVMKDSQPVTVNSGGILTFPVYVTGIETDRNYLNVLTLTDATVNGLAQFRMGNGVGTLTVNAGTAGSVISAGIHLVKNLGIGTALFNVADGNASADLNVSGAIGDTIGFPGAPVVKTGLGTMVLSGTNTYVGGTVVSNGTLLVNGSLTAASTGLVYSAATLGGTGRLPGTVAVNSGAVLAPGDPAVNGGLGSLTFGNLVLSNAWLLCEYGSSAADRVVVTNALTLPDRATVQVISVGNASLPSEIVLFSANTLTRTPNFDNWTINGCAGTVAVRDSTNVVLTITGSSPNTSYFWDINGTANGSGGATPSGNWNGSSNVWNTDFNGGSGTFTNITSLTDDLYFSASSDATGSYAVNLDGGTRSAHNLVFKNGAVSLTNGTLNLAASSTLSVNAGQAVIRATLSGAATKITKTGDGVLSISGTNTCAGGLFISQGQVTLNHTNAAVVGVITLGDTQSGDSPITLSVNVFERNIANAIVVSADGTGPVAINGTAIRVSYNGPLTLNRATTLGGDTTDRYGYTGKISGNVGVLTINSDRITFEQSAANSNTFSGRVVINPGKLLQLNSLYGISPAHAVEANGTLQLVFNLNSTIGTLTGTGFVRTYPAATYSGTLIMGGDNASGTFSGKMYDGVALTSILSVTKNGTGVQTLSGTNTYTGLTTINAGTLRLGVADAVTNSSITVASGGTLDLGGKTQNVKTLVGTGGTLQMTIAADGMSSDRVTVQGNLNLAGLSLNVAGQERLLTSRKYLIASCVGGTRTGRFNSTNLNTKWFVMYTSDGAQLEPRRGTLICVF